MGAPVPAPERDWEETFRTWSKPSSETEQAKSEHAERAVREAIRCHAKFRSMSIDVFAQGSYCNNTNVRLESDVDICVRLNSPFFTDFSMAEFKSEDVGLVDATYSFAEFKADVHVALNAYFGSGSVVRGSKAFDVHANTYRVDADVVACMQHRRYTHRNLLTRNHDYISGTEFLSDKGLRIVNWPEQQYANGVEKNIATGGRYKFITRAIKRLRNEMAEKRIAAAPPIPSFLIECLVWNVPNAGFGHDSYTPDARYVLAHTCNETRSQETCGEWGEVSELKYLFRLTQPWSREQANSFLNAAWKYVGFE